MLVTMQQPELKSSRSAAEVLGDLHPLLEQLGSAEALMSLPQAAGLLRVAEVNNLESLTVFLDAYKTRLLLAWELPSIQKAYGHAYGSETRELIELDNEIGKMKVPRDFAHASQRIGRWQLRRLRPLRSERVAQRYLQAVEEARARGWHTLVYGLTLALYSIPVRQGLLNYSRQTLGGFVRSAAGSLRLPETVCREVVDAFCEDIPHHLEALLNGPRSGGLRSV